MSVKYPKYIVELENLTKHVRFWSYIGFESLDEYGNNFSSNGNRFRNWDIKFIKRDAETKDFETYEEAYEYFVMLCL